ncbi:MAG: HAD-IA family hydrolase [Clostridia bacterium]
MKAVIFDMDGVLVDSEEAMVRSAIQALESYGIHPVKDDFLEFVGMGEDMFVGGVARKHGLEYVMEMKDLAYRIYVEKAKDQVIVFDGAKHVLEQARKAGLKLAVASAADRIKVETNLACIGVDTGFFDGMVTGSEITRKKPHPDIFLEAARIMGVRPGDCVVVEDALSGIEAAKRAGMAVIAVTTSFDRETLEEAGPDRVASSIRQAYELIGDFL